MIRIACITAFVFLPGLVNSAAAQRRVQSLAPEGAVDAPLTISGKVGGKSLRASGSGSCRHAPDASIRGLSASLWMVQYGGPRDAAVKQLNLTLWRPKDGSPDQLSLTVETGSGNHRIETGTGESKGAGSVTIIPNGPGGRLELTGSDADGQAIQITVECPTFAGIEAEGG